MNYGAILKKYRELAGYSQTEMANFLNVQQPCISKIENGHLGIDLPYFIAWVQLMPNREALLREVGLLDGRSFEVAGEDVHSVFFGLIKKEMLVQTASQGK